jgi:hypothetical protein
MKSYGLFFLLIGSLCWSQTTGTGSAAGNEGRGGTAGQAMPNKPLITIVGLCDDPAEQVKSPACTTIITRAQFERVINAIDPHMGRADRGQFAQHYSDVLVLAGKAEEMGLDKTPEFEEQMKLARIQTLSQILTKAIRAQAAQIPDKDIDNFYHDNLARFEKADFDRLYVPRTAVTTAVAGQGSNSAGKIDNSQGSEQAAKKEAENLRIRALGGEDFAALQTDAFQAAGIKSAPPATSVSLRRISLPPDQVSVMDLKPGDVSPVLSDPNGYYVYRMKTRNTLPLDQVRDEIIEAMRTQRIHDETDEILNSAKSTIDDSYFKR